MAETKTVKVMQGKGMWCCSQEPTKNLGIRGMCGMGQGAQNQVVGRQCTGLQARGQVQGTKAGKVLGQRVQRRQVYKGGEVVALCVSWAPGRIHVM